MKSASIGSLAALLSSPRPRDNEPNGFSLVEVLAALVIAALMLNALYFAFSSAAGAGSRADDRLAATRIAGSLIDEHTASRTLRSGTREGQHGMFAWTVTIAPAADNLAVATSGPWRLHQIVATVSWPPRRQIRVETLHLAKPDGTEGSP